MPDPVQIRQATPADAEPCGRICYEAFTAINIAHNFALEFPTAEASIERFNGVFAHPGFYSVVAEIGGRVVGSNSLDERSSLVGIGPISVAVDVQNRSVGRLLMQAVIERGWERGAPGIRLLQAAYHNRSLSLYTKLGFDAREPISVMAGPPMNLAMDGCRVRPATESDVAAADAVCARVHGHTRSGELRDALGQGIALVVERHGTVTGYATGFGYSGHAVGESNLDVQALLGAAKDIVGAGVLVPTRNAELFRWCLNHGWRVVHPMTLMTMGLYNEPAGAYLPSVLY